MSGRDRPGDETDYDWLYAPGSSAPGDPPAGPRTASGPGGPAGAGSAADDDATRLLPVTGRPGAAPGPLPTGSRTGPSQPPGGPPPTGPPRVAPTPGARRPRGRFRLRWVGLLLLAWLVYLVAAPVHAWTTVTSVDVAPPGERPAEQPGTTYLVVGSDARKGLGGARTDTIMLLHTGKGPNVLLSLPRDSQVEVPGHGTTKINAAFAYGGPRLLVRTVEQNTGLRVDGYVEIGFTGLVRLVDAVGGVRICPRTAMKDPQAHLDIGKGCQQADGRTALGYARSRKTQRLGDVDRARHQREVVSAIGAKVLSWRTLVDPVRYWRTVHAGASSVRLGKGTGPVSAAAFLLGMTRTSGGAGMTCGVPIRDLAVTWDRERANRLFELLAHDRTREVGGDLCRPSGLPR